MDIVLIYNFKLYLDRESKTLQWLIKGMFGVEMTLSHSRRAVIKNIIVFLKFFSFKIKKTKQKLLSLVRIIFGGRRGSWKKIVGLVVCFFLNISLRGNAELCNSYHFCSFVFYRFLFPLYRLVGFPISFGY